MLIVAALVPKATFRLTLGWTRIPDLMFKARQGLLTLALPILRTHTHHLPFPFHSHYRPRILHLLTLASRNISGA